MVFVGVLGVVLCGLWTVPNTSVCHNHTYHLKTIKQRAIDISFLFLALWIGSTAKSDVGALLVSKLLAFMEFV